MFVILGQWPILPVEINFETLKLLLFKTFNAALYQIFANSIDISLGLLIPLHLDI